MRDPERERLRLAVWEGEGSGAGELVWEKAWSCKEDVIRSRAFSLPWRSKSGVLTGFCSGCGRVSKEEMRNVGEKQTWSRLGWGSEGSMVKERGEDERRLVDVLWRPIRWAMDNNAHAKGCLEQRSVGGIARTLLDCRETGKMGIRRKCRAVIGLLDAATKDSRVRRSCGKMKAGVETYWATCLRG